MILGEKGVKILLIQPPFHRTKGMIWEGAHLGLGYLSSVVRREGLNCTIYNAELRQSIDNVPIVEKQMERYNNYHRYLDSLKDPNHFVWTEARNILNAYSPDLIGITFTTPAIDSAFMIAQIAKELFPRVPVVMGGPHVTVYPMKVLANHNVDYVVVGEGEKPFLELVRRLSEGNTNMNNIPGLCTKNGSKLRISAPDCRITKIDELPYPDRETIPTTLESNYPSILGTRGCPFNCSFCSSRNVWGKKVTTRSAKSMADELIFLRTTYNANDFYLYDDTFTTNSDRVEEFCDLLNDAKKRIRWSCSTRVDCLDEELICNLKRGGCTRVDIGIESADENLLAWVNKRISLSDVDNAVKLLHKHNLPFGAFFIAGYPDESEKSLQKTYDMMRDIKAHRLFLTILTPYPGTPLFEELKKQDILNEDIDWKCYSTDSPYGLLVQHMEKENFWRLFSKLSELVDRTNLANLNVIFEKYKKYFHYFTENPRGTLNRLKMNTRLFSR